MEKIIIYTDGGARNNPGPAGIGIVIYDEAGEILKEYKEYIGEATNNQAEYKALIKGLELAQDYIDSRLCGNDEKEGGNDKEVKINCFLDSELVVKQLNKEYKVKDPSIKELYNQVLDLAIFKNVNFEHIRREKNKLADRLVNEAIDEEVKEN